MSDSGEYDEDSDDRWGLVPITRPALFKSSAPSTTESPKKKEDDEDEYDEEDRIKNIPGNAIFTLLQDVKTPGAFACGGDLPFIIPGKKMRIP